MEISYFSKEMRQRLLCNMLHGSYSCKIPPWNRVKTLHHSVNKLCDGYSCSYLIMIAHKHDWDINVGFRGEEKTSQSDIFCGFLTGKELDPDFVAFNSVNQRVHFPARFYLAFRGVFGQIDPLVRKQWRSNPYTYAGNLATGRTDPVGLQDASEGPKTPSFDPTTCKRCGADVTQWFFVDMLIHWKWLKDTFGTHAITKPFTFKDYATVIDYKWRDFVLPEMCPINCTVRSITLCGKCLDRSELGNIVYGMAARATGFSEDTMLREGKQTGSGFNDEWSTAAGVAGWNVLVSGSVFGTSFIPKSAKEMCDLLTKSPEWSKIQDPKVKGCLPCEAQYDGPHTVPKIKLGEQQLTQDQIDALLKFAKE
jgi:hypothetical protein